MLTVREARPNDAEQIAKIHDETWKLTYGPIIADEDLKQVMSFERRKIMWETTLASKKVQQYVYVAEKDGKLLGFISGGRQRAAQIKFDAEIYDIYVLQEAQGQRVGHELLKHFVQKCLEEGYHSLSVWILTANPYGRFYVRYGAKKVEAENTTIGSGTYEETAFGWEDLKKLELELMETSL
ncbi:GNAT family N-acetyltransferase [Piscibacillus sp. B03]|uniref:GNAT family N-acetyltransferase n=1 Tax=Piscibacillus sp. B03 TaxID=3457430 RepID=UPI003FCE83B0